jgi:mRNA-degrading endonuclease HigB of HigAB toxin-antitoxin module
MYFLYNNVLVYNVNIKKLKTLQHVSFSIQIILRELVVSSLKSPILKLLKI